MDEGVDAGVDEVLGILKVQGVADHRQAGAVRLVDDGVNHLLADARRRLSVGDDLDAIDAPGRELPHRLTGCLHIVRVHHKVLHAPRAAVAHGGAWMPCWRSEQLADHEHPRRQQSAGALAVPHLQDPRPKAARVHDGGDAGLQKTAHALGQTLLNESGDVRVALEHAVRIGIEQVGVAALEVARQGRIDQKLQDGVNMQIGQARRDGLALGIDHQGAGGIDRAFDNGRNAIVLHNQACAVDRGGARAVEQTGVGDHKIRRQCLPRQAEEQRRSQPGRLGGRRHRHAPLKIRADPEAVGNGQALVPARPARRWVAAL